MHKLSFSIAFGGIASALCVLIMLLAAIIPFATYVCPMIAGFIMFIVSIECGKRIGIAAYISASALLLLISPEKESAMLFAAFFGYYPMLSIETDRLRSKFLKYLIRFSVFNISMIVSYFILMKVLVAVDSEEFTKLTMVLFLLCGNILLILYDSGIRIWSAYYVKKLRKRLFRRK